MGTVRGVPPRRGDHSEPRWRAARVAFGRRGRAGVDRRRSPPLGEPHRLRRDRVRHRRRLRTRRHSRHRRGPEPSRVRGPDHRCVEQPVRAATRRRAHLHRVQPRRHRRRHRQQRRSDPTVRCRDAPRARAAAGRLVVGDQRRDLQRRRQRPRDGWDRPDRRTVAARRRPGHHRGGRGSRREHHGAGLHERRAVPCEQRDRRTARRPGPRSGLHPIHRPRRRGAHRGHRPDGPLGGRGRRDRHGAALRHSFRRTGAGHRAREAWMHQVAFDPTSGNLAAPFRTEPGGGFGFAVVLGSGVRRGDRRRGCSSSAAPPLGVAWRPTASSSGSSPTTTCRTSSTRQRPRRGGRADREHRCTDPHRHVLAGRRPVGHGHHSRRRPAVVESTSTSRWAPRSRATRDRWAASPTAPTAPCWPRARSGSAGAASGTPTPARRSARSSSAGGCPPPSPPSSSSTSRAAGRRSRPMAVRSPSRATTAPPPCWTWNPTRWLEAACDLVGRNLTRDEWDQYMGSFSYRATCD